MTRTCVAFAAWLGLVTHAHADCLTPDPMLLWSYPADGDVDVPTNAQVWILSTLATVAPAPAVALNGKSIAASAATASSGQLSLELVHFDPHELDANTPYTLQVTYAPIGSQPEHSYELHFKTGAAHVAAGRGARITARFVEAPELSRSEPCGELTAVQGCFDTVEEQPPQVHRLALAASDAIAWFVRTEQPDGSILWPSACGAPRVFLRHAKPDECFVVRAVSRGGLLESEVRYCAKAATDQRKATASSAAGLRATPPRAEREVEAAQAPVAAPELKDPPAQAPPSTAPTPASEPPAKRGLCAAAQPGLRASGRPAWTWLGVAAVLVIPWRRRFSR